MPDQPAQRNEWSPRERGLVIGYRFAESGVADLAEILAAVERTIADDVREAVAAQLVEPDDIENPTMFWTGFTYGVRAYVVEQGWEQE